MPKTVVPPHRLRSIIPSLSWCSVHILLLSDVHGNLEALEACLAAAPPYDRVVNLGDIVGYGGSPNEVIERSRSLGNLFVRDRKSTRLNSSHRTISYAV